MTLGRLWNRKDASMLGLSAWLLLIFFHRFGWSGSFGRSWRILLSSHVMGCLLC
ncbi:hypothetical protein M438DRAFT_150900 [Aureobasidium pullulans EXF-150]|uniref:Uncharacterized protein n=1 Tax=Aureobasidium pullulans EXF-150 TaxID=1043002 RepID=A0A074X1Q2_AURPU|nr:uncharacterized protein M438DRAFT_150900 [Aureobasidium pullulans EXF-150]KEQ79333.1 hypothetical protein M438DRAFT_150900 [Aureobasidium pullulans EXF-150]